MKINIHLDIVPHPQKQTQLKIRHGKRYFFDPSKEESNNIKLLVRSKYQGIPTQEAVSLRIGFQLPIPAYLAKKTPSFHVKKPDVDNLAYLVTNALKGILYEDDSQVYELTLSKRYSKTPGIDIEMSSHSISSI